MTLSVVLPGCVAPTTTVSVGVTASTSDHAVIVSGSATAGRWFTTSSRAAMLDTVELLPRRGGDASPRVEGASWSLDRGASTVNSTIN